MKVKFVVISILIVAIATINAINRNSFERKEKKILSNIDQLDIHDFDRLYRYGDTYDNYHGFRTFFNVDDVKEREYFQALTLRLAKEMLDSINDEQIFCQDLFLDPSTPVGKIQSERELKMIERCAKNWNLGQCSNAYADQCGRSDHGRGLILKRILELNPGDKSLYVYLKREICFGNDQTLLPLLQEASKRFGVDFATQCCVIYQKRTGSLQPAALAAAKSGNKNISTKYTPDAIKKSIKDYAHEWAMWIDW